MIDTLVRTKLAVPQIREGLVHRPALRSMLDSAKDHSLLLVSAPAGFGKTTVVSEWLAARELPVGWFALDHADNDPLRFATYFIAACRQIGQHVGAESAVMLGSDPNPSAEVVMGLLVNDFLAMDRRCVLVLDDYHVVENPWIHDAVQFVLDHHPAGLLLVVITRHDPPLALSRLRVRNEITEIRPESLRLDADEARCFLNEVMELGLSDQHAKLLGERTEGWLAGLQLAALAVRDASRGGLRSGATTVDRLVNEFGGGSRLVFEYLAEEVLRSQPPDVRDFLVRTSVPRRLKSTLCDALTAREDSASLLRELSKGNLFLEPMSGDVGWYRYHDLFADFLRSNLSDDERANLHLVAARWFLQMGHWEDAGTHALESGRFDEAVPIVIAATDSAIREGSLAMLGSWIDALPESVVSESPDLSVLAAVACLLSRRMEDAEHHARRAAEMCDASTQTGLRGRILALQAQLTMCTGNIAKTVELSHSALSALDPADFLFRDFVTSTLGGSLEIAGDLPSAASAYQESLRTAPADGKRITGAVTVTNLIHTLNDLGRRREALDLCRDVDSRAKHEGGPGYMSDALCLGWSLLSLEGNEIELAIRQAERAMQVCERGSVLSGFAWAKYVLARAHAARGDTMRSLQTIEEARRLPMSGKPHQGWFRAVELDVALKAGHAAAAESAADLSRLAPKGLPEHWNDIPRVSYARFLLAEDRHDEAADLLQRLTESAVSGGRNRTLISAWLLDARLKRAGGEEEQARTLARKALSTAAADWYVRAVADELPYLLDDLELMRGEAPHFVEEVLAAHRLPEVLRTDAMDEAYGSSLDGAAGGQPAAGLSSGAVRRPDGARAAALLHERLTEREIAVLRQVANGLSNNQIGDLLFVSVGTVKKHLNNVFGKLGVASRTQAIAKARELGLI